MKAENLDAQQLRPEGTLSGGPLVSIALPVFNNEKTLFRAIRSIQLQTYVNWELLVMDDGSTDRTCAIARSFRDPRIRVYEDPVNRGISTRLNAAVELAKGEYFARMDGDDISFPERLETQVKYLADHPNIDLLGTGVVVFREDGNALGTLLIPEKHGDICKKPWFGIPLAHPTWMGRKSWFEKNPYKTWMKKAQDQDLLLRTHSSSCFESLQCALVGYHEEARTLKKMFIARWYFLLAAINVFVCGMKFSYAILVVVVQMLKIIGDVFNLCVGIKNFRNQLDPLSLSLRNEWEKVWVNANSL